MSKIRMDIKPLNDLVASISKKHVVRVGVLGGGKIRGVKMSSDGKIGKKADTDDNAYIGAVHEFGCLKKRIPARSWLKFPLQEKGSKIVSALGKDATFKDALLKGNIASALERVGAACVSVISEAFNSRGFGQWPANAARTILQKNGRDTPLLDTRQLFRAVTWQVVAK